MVLEACRFGNANSMLTAARSTGSAHVEEAMVKQILLDLLLGLKYLHANHVAHRDIKLENVLLDDALTFKLGDLGSARRIDVMLTSFAGTPMYMAPEVCCPCAAPHPQQTVLVAEVGGSVAPSDSQPLHSSPCDVRVRRQVLFRQPYREKSDIWSLGHLIYEVCTQERLFTANTMQSLIQKHDQPYKGIDTGYYSEALACTVAWLLTQDSELRPSAQEVLSSPFLRQLLQEQLEELQLRR
jgi:NIMA (never in mitosis gene a)-related kinase